MSRALYLLLLEDDPLDAELIVERIERAGYVLTARRVATREDYLASLDERWDLIISDYNVPGYDGREALDVARAIAPDVPFIFVTGAIGEDRAIDLLKRGATDYVLKDRLDRLETCVERALREAQERRALHQRNEFEQQLVAIVSHDLRSPLNVILLAAEAALEYKNIEPGLARHLQRIHNASDRACSMIRDILDFSQARAGEIRIERRSVDLHELVARYAEETEVANVGRRVQVRAQGNTRGEWDPDRLGQVVSNLLSNAIRYSPATSTVGVAVAGGQDRVVLEVHNDGEPIPHDLRRRLFEPHSRGDEAVNRAVRSVGLGLYIVNHIVRAHQGQIDVQSDLGVGTTFRVELPRNQVEAL